MTFKPFGSDFMKRPLLVSKVPCETGRKMNPVPILGSLDSLRAVKKKNSRQVYFKTWIASSLISIS